MHNLLQKQIDDLLPGTVDREALAPLLEAVSRAYADGDRGRRRLERSINLMSDEMQAMLTNIRDEKAAVSRAEMEREAERERSRTKSLFLAAMSHEIRTPLNAVIGAASLLKASGLTQRQQDYVDMLFEGGDILLGVINDIIDTSRIEAGKLELEDVPFDVRCLFNRTMMLWLTKAREKNIYLDYAIEGEETVTHLSGDANRIKQILCNLVSNAIKFTHEGGVKVTARLARQEDGLVGLDLSVEDSGIGIPADRIEGILEPFEQVDASVTRQYGGSGLGLNITRNLTELMGGMLTVSSEPGVGSVFSVTVPLREADGVDAQPEPEDIEDICAHRLTVLLAEDIVPNQFVLKALLENYQCTVDIAANGAEAVEFAALRPYDLILMDYHMPLMDGIEATRAIRASGGPNAQARIVALTADAMKQDRERFFAAGMDGFVAKPVTETALRLCLLEALKAQAGETAAEKHSETA